MFTGLIEEVGKVAAVQRGADSARLTVEAPRFAGRVALGESVAIDGVCLTVAEVRGARFSFDAVPETMRRTTLGSLRAGDPVNLERALSVGQRLGGHFVQGHVDGTATLAHLSVHDNARVLRFRVVPGLARYLVEKGSVAVDGISLTVVEAGSDSFTVSVIPHTWEHTALKALRIGEAVNIETDMLAKYVEKLLAARAGGVTESTLAESGFLNE